MSNTNSLIQSMNMVTLEDEEEISYEIIAEEEQEQPSQYFQGFNPKLCVVGHFIVEGKVDFLALNTQWQHYGSLERESTLRSWTPIYTYFNSFMK